MKDFPKILDKKTDELFSQINDYILVNCFRIGASWIDNPRENENEYISFFIEEKTEENMKYYEMGKEWAISIFHKS